MTSPNQSPIACTLPEPDRKARAAEVRAGLLRRVRETRELVDGVALGFPPTSEDEVREFVAFEEQCCGFARFTVRRDDAGLWLDIRGPEGTVDFVRALLSETDAGETSEAPATERPWLGFGAVGAVAAMAAFILCETAMLGLLLGAVGLAGATAVVASWLDALGVLLVVASVGALAFAFARRRRRLGDSAP